jgi:hypothetical protein
MPKQYYRIILILLTVACGVGPVVTAPFALLTAAMAFNAPGSYRVWVWIVFFLSIPLWFVIAAIGVGRYTCTTGYGPLCSLLPRPSSLLPSVGCSSSLFSSACPAAFFIDHRPSHPPRASGPDQTDRETGARLPQGRKAQGRKATALLQP